MDLGNKFKKIIIPLIIIAVGLVGRYVLVQSRPVPEKQIKENNGPLVDYLTIMKEDHKVIVSGTGTVIPKQEASVTPQVNGKVTYFSQNFVAGGIFKKGDLFFKIESIDYELALEQAEANLERLQNEFNRSESLFKNGMINEHDFEKTLDDYKVAQSKLKQAKLDLQRTEMHAPFNCLIRSKDIDIGQYVRSGNSVGMIAGTDSAEIVIPLPQEDLYWINIPQKGNKNSGASAQIIKTSGDKTFTWQGQVVRTLGEINARDRMERVVVEVLDPYQLKNGNKGERPDLAVGTFIEVELYGDVLPEIYSVPRRTLQENSTLWIIDDSDKLESRHINIVRREKEMLIVREGINDGDRILITNIPGAANGLKVRPVKTEVE